MPDIKLRLDPEILDAIDQHRAMERPIPSRVEMIRRLIGIGLAENLKRAARRAR